jgi:hypothetical protein
MEREIQFGSSDYSFKNKPFGQVCVVLLETAYILFVVQDNLSLYDKD